MAVIKSFILAMALLSLMGSQVAAATERKAFDLKKLDNSDLLDLLESDPDDPFLLKGKFDFRELQDTTEAPTASPRDLFSTTAPSPSLGHSTVVPSASPTMTPTEPLPTVPTAAPATLEPTTSGVWRPVSMTAVTLGLIMLTVVSGSALM